MAAFQCEKNGVVLQKSLMHSAFIKELEKAVNKKMQSCLITQMFSDWENSKILRLKTQPTETERLLDNDRI